MIAYSLSSSYRFLLTYKGNNQGKTDIAYEKLISNSALPTRTPWFFLTGSYETNLGGYGVLAVATQPRTDKKDSFFDRKT